VSRRKGQRFDEAITAYQDAAAIYREAGDRQGERMALGNLKLARDAVRPLLAPDLQPADHERDLGPRCQHI
jgi:hypothetical protein